MEDRATGVVVGNDGTIFNKLNGGTWTNASSKVPPRIIATQMLTTSTGILVSEDGTLYKTIDGCANVLPLQGNTSGIVPTDLYFFDATKGFLIGEAGKILNVDIASNNTVTFTNVTSGTTSRLNKIIFDNTKGLIAGNNGVILYSSNKGISWSSSTLSAYTNINDIQLIDANLGFAVCDGGTILKTTNGGSSWVSLTNNGIKWTNNNLKTVYFRDHNNGLIAGVNNTILQTYDAGGTFEVVNKPGLTGQSTINALVENGEDKVLIVSSGKQLENYTDIFAEYSSRFWYDELGRLIISQNAKQLKKGAGAYSYSIYDALGKITEVGEITNRPVPTAAMTHNNTSLASWIAGGTKTEINRTYYNYAVFSVPGLNQENLRNRISSVTYQDIEGVKYDFATHYSYDIHGNVDVLIQDNPALVNLGQRYKKVGYEYDLLSGNVNQVVYQKGEPDAFYHQYTYDADNRITIAMTSTDGIIWEQDAKYFYSDHGPLARVEIGDQKVQGVDYAYTIQGWMKGVNSTTLNETREIGHDGSDLVNNLHAQIARDEYAYELGYFKNDYQAISSSDDKFRASMTGSEIEADTRDMYNGNISSMVTSVRQFMQGGASPLANSYQYDQLNRLSNVTTYSDPNVVASNQWGAQGTKQLAYGASYSYDANGNLQTLKRNADVNTHSDNTGMDNLSYIYENKANGYDRNTNKLVAVLDATDNSNNSAVDAYGDLKPGQQYNVNDRAMNNYQYDEIGNLVKDQQEEIYNIEWTVSGKVKRIERNADSKKPDLVFGYDATGNRVYKIVKPRTGSGLMASTEWKTTYYTRDASGNQMAVYEVNPVVENGIVNEEYRVVEFNIFGSSRLGVKNVPEDKSLLAKAPKVSVANSAWDLLKSQTHTSLQGLNIYRNSYVLGKKNYELSNHLGNVLNVVTDRKLAVPNANSTTVEYYTAQVVSYSDYFPFGMQMPGRKGRSGDKYSYGFQGELMDDELKGEDNSVNFEFRMHDPRIGRFFAIDPLAPKYPHNGPYNFSENRVIDGIELEGLEVFLIHGTNMSSAKNMFDSDAIKQIQRIGGNTITDDNFSWSERSGTFNDRAIARKISADELVAHVVATRKQLMTDGKIKGDEPITLFGYSHGGNISIQAIDEIEKQTGSKVQLITYATPAYNDGSTEDPATKKGISKHISFYSEGDGVDGLAGGDETYNNGFTVNYKIPSKIIPHNGAIDTHCEMGSKWSNSKIAGYFKSTVGKIADRIDFKKTKEPEKNSGGPAKETGGTVIR